MLIKHVSTLAATAAAGLLLAACGSTGSTVNTTAATSAAPVASPVSSTVASAAASTAAKTTAPASAAPSPIDNPAFDMTGSGTDCTMTYGSNSSGGTVTVVTVDEPGEIITHVSDSQGIIHRNDTQITQGPNAFTYDVPLNQVGDMGAVFYPTGASSESCTIEPTKS